MSDLRNDVALYLANWCGEAEPTEADWKAADAVLRVVGEAITSDKAVQAASVCQPEGCYVEGVGNCGGTHTDCYYRGVLSAAWQVVTGSNHE